ncbi:MAG: hypothetical protein ABL949_01035 [Fimbriimonadaceae bacterium]
MRINPDERTSALLSRASTMLISLTTVIALGVCTFALVNTARAKAADIEVGRLSRDLKSARASLEKAREVTKAGSRIDGPSGKPAVNAFQAEAEKRANLYGCSFECRVGDPALYISKFLNEPDKTLQQVELTMILRGPLDRVVQTLQSFKTFNIPFEYGDLTLQRGTDADSIESVTANLTTAVLIPTTEGVAH